MKSNSARLDGAGHVPPDALLWRLDDELPPEQRAEIDLHLARCEPCRRRRDRLVSLQAPLAAPGARDGSVARVRVKLVARLTEVPRRREWSAPAFTPRRWAIAAGLCLALVLAGRALSDRVATLFVPPLEAASLPSARLTPGAVDAIPVGRLCADARRDMGVVSLAVQDAVLSSYKMAALSPADYELDYLITPELGGANDRRNLWPQRYASPVWNALVKDDLEALLPKLVCAGQLDLETAQRDIAGNWIAAYKKYFRTRQPLPIERRAGADDDGPVLEARALFEPPR